MLEFRVNRPKQKLAAGEVVTLVMGDYSADTAELLASSGIDILWGEMEDGTTSWRDIADYSRAADLWGACYMVRVTRNDPTLIGRALACGAGGIMVPHVNTADEARAVARASYYGPRGMRGMAGGRRSYGAVDYHREANENVLTAILLEDVAMVPHLPDIVQVEGIDVFYVAPGDLSQSMGLTGQTDHPDVRRVVNDSIATIVTSGKVAGALVNETNLEQTLAQGVRFIGTSWEGWLSSSARRFADRAHAGRT
ncbi:MAG: 4-hydroxy-2-oxoheptanedioate aldolase [Chloroflexota bacterium]|nr:4-hydroxy-2-oxoheptanedioate aldolase [Chloroflexota bacterium]